jgi:hypothetical protein
MARKLYYQDSYGRWQRDRTAGRGSGLPGGLILKLLLILAVIIVIASFIP